jgi:hypothetical protein
LCWPSLFKKKVLIFGKMINLYKKANISSELFPEKSWIFPMIIKSKAKNCAKETGIFKR